MQEIWKPVVGYEGLYEVSNFGRVRSLHYYGGDRIHILSPSGDKDGYLQIGLYKDGKCNKRKIHRLVAIAFIPNENNLECINHKDENKTNNTVKNLEWCTKFYNNTYGERVTSIPEKRSIPIIQKTLDGEVVTVWKSASEACRNGDYNYSRIRLCCLGKAKTHKGYIWENSRA